MSALPPSIPGPVQSPPSGATSRESGVPLDDMQLLLLRQAVVRRRPVRRAAWVAFTSAWTILVIAVLAWPVVMLMPSPVGLVVVAGITLVGVMEYIGSGRMWRMERSAPAFLARNQLTFVLLIVAYCVYRMVTFSPQALYSSPETREMLAQVAGDLQEAVEAVVPFFYYAIYGLIAFLIVVCQGGLACYYITRRQYIDRFERETPAWVKQLMAEVER